MGGSESGRVGRGRTIYFPSAVSTWSRVSTRVSWMSRCEETAGVGLYTHKRRNAVLIIGRDYLCRVAMRRGAASGRTRAGQSFADSEDRTAALEHPRRAHRRGAFAIYASVPAVQGTARRIEIECSNGIPYRFFTAVEPADRNLRTITQYGGLQQLISQRAYRVEGPRGSRGRRSRGRRYIPRGRQERIEGGELPGLEKGTRGD